MVESFAGMHPYFCFLKCITGVDAHVHAHTLIVELRATYMRALTGGPRARWPWSSTRAPAPTHVEVFVTSHSMASLKICDLIGVLSFAHTPFGHWVLSSTTHTHIYIPVWAQPTPMNDFEKLSQQIILRWWSYNRLLTMTTHDDLGDSNLGKRTCSISRNLA
jgi:hypothetical protein